LEAISPPLFKPDISVISDSSDYLDNVSRVAVAVKGGHAGACTAHHDKAAWLPGKHWNMHEGLEEDTAVGIV